MSEPIIGQIELLPNYIFQSGDIWKPCNGQLLSVDDYNELFSLIGTIYGGDGENVFALPNLNARVPVGCGTHSGLPGIVIGQAGGVDTVRLNTNTMPPHSHRLLGSKATTSSNPVGNVPSVTSDGAGADVLMYKPGPHSGRTMSEHAVSEAGAGKEIDIRSPYLGLLYVIATRGMYPVFDR